VSAAAEAGGAAAGPGDTRPLVVLAGGRVAALARTNAKGYAKSLADRRLWALDARTGRLLPLELPGKLVRLAERSGWYEAEIESEAGPDEAATAAAAAGPAAAAGSEGDAPEVLARLAALIAQRRRELPPGSYTTYLFEEGSDKIRKKLGEEAVELILAAERPELVHEAADLIYHLLVLLEDSRIGLDEVLAELSRRAQAG
jgi:phosphoribosyl-ATP pyrophosphohydrolase